jgi:hypothetical protein
MSVASTHPDYDRFAPKWKRARDCVAGQDAIHKAGVDYLPKLRDETDPEYKARIKRSDFFNGTWRTIAGLGGMAFRKPPTVEVPKGIEPYLLDVDLAGRNIDALAKETLDEILSVGRFFILVDHPPQQFDDKGKVVPITKAVAEQIGLRPTLQTYPAESLINWQFGRVNNAWVLMMVVLKECKDVSADKFERKFEDRWRVLELVDAADESGNVSKAYRQQVWRKKDKPDGKDEYEQVGPDIYPLMDGKKLSYIPGVIVGADGRGDQIDEPPLIDLIDKNIAHYQVNADYRHGLHFTGLPTLFLSGMVTEGEGKQEFHIGSTAAITSQYPDAKGMFIEFTGQGLGAMEKALDRIEKQMAMLGARMIADETAQRETLGATQIKRQGENGVLSRIAQAVSEAIEWSLGVFAEWAGHPGDVVYQINRDFQPTLIDAPTLTALTASLQAGAISQEEFFDLLQRGDMIKAETTFEEHQTQIDANGPASPAKPAVDPSQAAA